LTRAYQDVRRHEASVRHRSHGRGLGFLRRQTAIAATAAVAFAAGLARAEPPPVSVDTLVRLRSGAVYQGELVERVPGDHITLRLVTGEIKRLGDAEVSAVEDTRGARPKPPEGEARTVRVDLQSTRPEAALVRIAARPGGLDGNFNGSLAGSSEGQLVCVAPCGLAVAPGRFVVGGPGLRQSEVFELTGRNPGVRIAADPGTEGKLTGGIVLAGLGALSGLVGLGMIEVSAIDGYDRYDDGYTSRQRAPSQLLPVGLALLGLGAVVGVIGVVMAANSQTKVELAPLP
jgi:hypothetical protein